MPVQMSAYLKAVIRSIVFYERKGKAGAKRKQSPNGFTAIKNSPQQQREQRGQN